MKKYFQSGLLLLTVIFYYTNSLHAQRVKIGTNPTVVNPNSLLELESTGKGVLMPRSTTGQIAAMTNVPKGMLLFNTTDSALYLKRDTGWVVIPVSQRGVNATLQVPAYGDFYALVPPNNPPPIIIGGFPIEFPQIGAISGGISPAGPTAIVLSAIGAYQVMFEVSVTEQGQLVVALNGAELPYTVVGRATGTSQITGMFIITTTLPFSQLEIRNAGPFPLTITPNAGGIRPVSAHLVITKLQ
ncbi:MAG: hypothetical protein V4722_06330 [Bacteroidota bacterium]